MLLTNNLCMWALCNSTILNTSSFQLSQLSGYSRGANTKLIPTNEKKSLLYRVSPNANT